MKVEKIIIASVIVIVAGFALLFVDKITTYRSEVQTVTAYLQQQGMDDVRVFPKLETCYSYNATGYRGTARSPYSEVGTVCMDEVEGTD